MRHYFHLIGPAEVIADDLGVEVESTDQARRAALNVVEEFRQTAVQEEIDLRGWKLLICARDGRVVQAIELLTDALPAVEHLIDLPVVRASR